MEIIMPQETNNLLLGAGISLLSTTLLFILTSIYNWKVKNRDRAWVIEDRKYQRRLEVLSVRLKEVEDYINQIFDIAENMFRYELILVQTKKVDNTQVFYSDFYLMMEKISRTKSSVLNLHDEELGKLSQEFADYIIAELNIAGLLEEKIKNCNIVEENIENKRVIDFFVKAMDMRKLVIKRIDHLSGF
jgi:hypothetical protein